jgi:hypothetical protein
MRRITYGNEVWGIRPFTSNLLRNMTLELNTYNLTFNRRIEAAVRKIHLIIRYDIDDRRTTWKDQRYTVFPYTLVESRAGSIIHFSLFLFIFLLLFTKRNFRKIPRLLSYIAQVVTGVLLFVLFLKWQLTHSRLHLPFFVLISPAIALGIGQYRKAITNALGLALLLVGLSVSIAAGRRPLIPNLPYALSTPGSLFQMTRESQYLINLPETQQTGIRDACKFLCEALDADCAAARQDHYDIGLVSGLQAEYAYWALLKKAKPSLRIEWIDLPPEHEARKLTMPEFSPFAVFYQGTDKEKLARYTRDFGSPQQFPGDIYLFLRRESG